MSKRYSWSEMSADVMELIFSKLPERSVLRASSVCKGWNSVVRDPAFIATYNRNQGLVTTLSPYHFRLEGRNYSLKKQDRAFSVQLAESDDDISYNFPTITNSLCQRESRATCLKGGGGILYALVNVDDLRQVMYFKLSLLEKDWKATPHLPYRMYDPMPIVGVVNDMQTGNNKVVCAGQIDSTNSGLVVQIYDCGTCSWSVGEVLPYEFRDSPHSFTTSVVHGQRIFAYDNFMGFVSELDIYTKQWSKVKMVWLSSKVQRSCLFSQSEGLFLAAIEDANDIDLRCNVWSIDESTLQRRELLHSQLILNARPAASPSFIKRKVSLILDISSMCIFLVLLLLVQFFVYCHSVTTRSGRLVHCTFKSGILRLTSMKATMTERVKTQTRIVANLLSLGDSH